ncbi:MAG: methyltransferase domain-containing protein [Candidatus Andersenbacteria bacterium]|nr:methyltransferase domain-containing protein [Candidatus Andersenbacteria bacterium]
MYKQIKENWNRSSDELSGTDAFWERSALGLSLLVDFKKILNPQNIKGKLLDAGAGKLSYRHLVKPYCHEYKSMDFHPTHPELDYLADIQLMPVGDASFDTVLSAEVLEHVPDPEKALREMYRVLKPGGKLVMSIPHLMYLHNEPHDFYRYTKYGLRILLERVGFVIEYLEPSGGIFSFFQGIIATTLIGLTYNIPILWPIVFHLSKFTSLITIWLDNHTDKKKIFALHFIAVAHK